MPIKALQIYALNLMPKPDLELKPKYCDVIIKRYIGVTGKTDVRLLRDGEEIPVEDTGILD